MNLKEAQDGKEYIITRIETDDEELNAFLFSLGCYSGEAITVVRHLKGGCCGGGSGYKPKKKRLPDIRYRKIFTVEGMHCEHCKNRVEEVVNDIPGVAGRVDLKRGELTVSYAEGVEDAKIKERIERAGYTVTDIKDA